MNAPARVFESSPAARISVPLLIGLMGPSGGGKTFSALRLAQGIQTVTGGDVYGIDTEARRMLHYADLFKFKHVPFSAPFGSLDYLEALRFCVKQGGRVIIVDSMSHEHEGPGGMIDFQDKELDRLAGNDWGKRERMKMLAWQNPKKARRTLINGLLQLEANFIFCFRAKETVKPVKVDGKTEMVQQGFMPIAGQEFVFEQTVNCLLLPAAGGVPSWKSENMGERQMMKLPEQFREIFAERKPLDEDTGRKLAEWAKGGAPAALEFGKDEGAIFADRLKTYDAMLRAAAERGGAALKDAWKNIPRDGQNVLKAALDVTYKPRAAAVDDSVHGFQELPATAVPPAAEGGDQGTGSGTEPSVASPAFPNAATPSDSSAAPSRDPDVTIDTTIENMSNHMVLVSLVCH